MIRNATAQDVLDMSQKLRVEDEKEIEALTGLDTLAALTLGYFHSDSCMAAVGRSGNVCGLFGVVPVAEAVGSVWLLTSHEIVPNIREVLETGNAWLDEQNAIYPVLTNIVTASNSLHLTLIEHLGFQLGSPYTLDDGETRVIPFERRS